jgi:hypothetical protein
MNKLLDAINSESTFTENGMPTFASSMSDHVDLFFQIGASRGKDIIPQFSKAFAGDKELAARIALWARDVRGGAGERQLFRNAFKFMAEKDVAFAKRVMVKVPEVGRWDDLLCLFGTGLERDALRMIARALEEGNGLCAKWMPRKGDEANKLRAYLQKTPKQYRKMLVELTNVVETKMCANEWDSIEFGKLPSKASAMYQKAFARHTSNYQTYIDGLQTGTEKINAGAVYPHDVITSLKHGNAKVADAQWNALPDYLEGSKENIIAMSDVSGSMDALVSGSKTVRAMDVSIALGLYLSERSRGIFKDHFITFTERPHLQSVKGSLSDRYRQLQGEVGYSTNFQAAFELILDAAVKHNVPESDMPTMILALSDMQFNQASNTNEKAIDMIKNKYQRAGYKMPKLVFWNLRASNGVPTKFDTTGTALVSGFSPSIMTSLLGGGDFTPEGIMLEAVNKPRYDI